MNVKRFLANHMRVLSRKYSILPSFLSRRIPAPMDLPSDKNTADTSWRTVYFYKNVAYSMVARMALLGLLGYHTVGYFYYTDHFIISECLWMVMTMFFSRNAIRSRLGRRVIWRVDYSESTGEIKLFRCFVKEPITVFLQEVDMEVVGLGMQFKYMPRNRIYYLHGIQTVKAGSKEIDSETIGQWIKKCHMCRPNSTFGLFRNLTRDKN
jgi:hypothetical protein